MKPLLPLAAIPLSLASGLCLRAAAPPAHRPNILYIMADDHGYQAIGAYQSRLEVLNPTPTIDRLAREGMRLDRVFCTNSICCPSRATIITGQYSQMNGVLTLRQGLPPDRQYLPLLMRKAGYATAIVGKWHLRSEPQFDFYEVLKSEGSYFNPKFYEKGHGRYPNNMVTTHGYSTDLITDAALAWLKRRDTSKPFFLCLHYKAPHDNFKFAPRYADYLKNVHIPEPENLLDQGEHGSIATRGYHDELIHFIGSSVGPRNVFRNDMQVVGLTRQPGETNAELTRAAYQRYLKMYLRCVKGIDDNLKRVFAYLQSQGLMNNTVIFYTSDQGMCLGEHDYIDKRWMYEESMRMPLLVRYPPEIKAGTTSKALINNTDFAPTILDFAGVKTPSYMQGRSFRSILDTGKTPKDWRTATYYRYWMHLVHHLNPAHFGIRTNRYKLIFFYGNLPNGKGIQTPPGWEFYDLKNDPHEMHNLYNDPAYAGIIAGLKRRLIQLRIRFHETDAKYPAVRAIIKRFWYTTPEARAAAIKISHEDKVIFTRIEVGRARQKAEHHRVWPGWDPHWLTVK